MSKGKKMAERIGEKIREARKAAKLTQVELAEKLGVQQPLISDWERGDSIPTVASLVRLAPILNVDPGALIG